MNRKSDNRFPELDIKLTLKHLTRLDSSEGWENSKPYLWNIFFKIDNSSIKIGDNFRLSGKTHCQFSSNSHNNLGIRTLGGNNKVKIPSGVGTFRSVLEPLEIPHFEAHTSGIAGLISILMEENNVSAKGAEAGHQVLNQSVESKMNKLIAGFDPRKVDVHNLDESIETYFKSRAETYAAEIEGAVGEAVKSKQSLFQNIWSLLSRDTMIGYEIWKFSTEDLVKENGQIEFSKKWETRVNGNWEIDGEILAKKKGTDW